MFAAGRQWLGSRRSRYTHLCHHADDADAKFTCRDFPIVAVASMRSLQHFLFHGGARVCVSMSLRVRAHRPQFANYCFFCCGRVFFCRRATVVLRWSGNCTLHTTHTQRWKCILNRWITRTKINYSNINNEQGGCVWFFGWANAANARLSLTFRLAVHANRGWERNDGRWAVFDMCGVLPI